MLYYSSIHPEWDCFGSFASSEKGRLLSELLEAVVMNHHRNTGQCFAMLERLGVILGNGAFASVLIQRDPFGSVDAVDTDWIRRLVQEAAGRLSVPLWYCFSVSGRVYILCCYPRLTEESPDVLDAGRELLADCTALQAELAQPALRIILSDLQYGETGVFRTFNNLHHAMEYFDFRSAYHSPIQLNSEEQLHGALIGDMSVYRQLAVEVAEQLSRGEVPVADIAGQVCDRLLQNSVPSMESVHHHIQIFMLTFTDYLGQTGLVDASYISRRQIVYRAMGFERESEFREIMRALLEELQQQNQTLKKIGRQKRIQSIREYVETHISDPELSPAQISDRFQVSTAQISKQFRYYYGVSLHRFLQQTRLQRAEALLRDHPDWSMRKIAEAAGYTDLSTMYRAFRALGNMTPGALRDSLRLDGLSE